MVDWKKMGIGAATFGTYLVTYIVGGIVDWPLGSDCPERRERVTSRRERPASERASPTPIDRRSEPEQTNRLYRGVLIKPDTSKVDGVDGVTVWRAGDLDDGSLVGHRSFVVVRGYADADGDRDFDERQLSTFGIMEDMESDAALRRIAERVRCADYIFIEPESRGSIGTLPGGAPYPQNQMGYPIVSEDQVRTYSARPCTTCTPRPAGTYRGSR